MKATNRPNGEAASANITKRIEELGDWRGEITDMDISAIDIPQIVQCLKKGFETWRSVRRQSRGMESAA